MQAQLATALSKIDYSDMETAIPQIKAAMDAVSQGATDAAGTLAADFYRRARAEEIGGDWEPPIDTGYAVDATEGATSALVQRGVDGDTASMDKSLLDRIDYEIKKASSETILNAGKRDRKRPKFARVPTGGETCTFCLMLASRGFVYKDEVAASHAHAHCDCRVVPGWGGTKVQGYDPKDLYRQWDESMRATARNRAEKNGTTEREEYDKRISALEKAAKASKDAKNPRKQARKRAETPEPAYEDTGEAIVIGKIRVPYGNRAGFAGPSRDRAIQEAIDAANNHRTTFK